MNTTMAIITATTEDSDFGWTLANTRNLLHLITVITWVGGQIVMGALVPALIKLGPEAPKKVARQFNRIAWPAFFLAILTGLWNVGSTWEDSTNGWKVVLLIKLGLVALTGIAAWRHQESESKLHKMIFGGLTLLISIAVVVLGIGLGN